MTIKEQILQTPLLENEGAGEYYRRVAGMVNSTYGSVKRQYIGLLKLGKVNMIGKKNIGRPKHCQSISSLNRPTVHGVTLNSERKLDFEKHVLPNLINLGKRAQDKMQAKAGQTITVNKLPFMLCLMSDIHGGAKCDYETIASDVKIIRDTEDCYCIVAGDVTDNFIIGSLSQIQKAQPTTHENEIAFSKWFCDMIKDKLLAWISGNHDNWTYKVSGIDPYKYYLKTSGCLYDRNEVIFDLINDGVKERWIVRHKWKSGSIFNPTHGIEVGWERNGEDFDVGVGGHTHIATLHREFIKHDIKRSAIILGTYKLLDEFGKEIGFANTHSGSKGSGAFVYDKKFKRKWFDNLPEAVEYLEYLKKK
jgi:predicted phosphodiesterase